MKKLSILSLFSIFLLMNYSFLSGMHLALVVHEKELKKLEAKEQEKENIKRNNESSVVGYACTQRAAALMSSLGLSQDDLLNIINHGKRSKVLTYDITICYDALQQIAVFIDNQKRIIALSEAASLKKAKDAFCKSYAF